MTIRIKQDRLKQLARNEGGYDIAAGRTTTNEVAVVKSVHEILAIKDQDTERNQNGEAIEDIPETEEVADE